MVDSKKEKQQEELRAFGRYFPEGNRREGVLGEIKKDLEKIKKINDHEKKLQEINFALSKHRTNESHARTHYFNGKLNEINISHEDTLGKYSKLIRELNDLRKQQQEREREREREREQCLSI